MLKKEILGKILNIYKNENIKLTPLILTFKINDIDILISGKSELMSNINKNGNIFEDYDHRYYYFFNDLSQSLKLNNAFFSLGENYISFNYKGVFQL